MKQTIDVGASLGNDISSSLPSSLLPIDEDTRLCLSLINAPTSTGNLALPGPSPESTEAVVEFLRHNFLLNHPTYGKGRIYHHHAMDHMLTVYALGGSPEAMREVLIHHNYTEPIVPGPDAITDANFFDHLGEQEYFYPYMVYFSKLLVTTSPTDVLQKFIFSPSYNYNPDLPKFADFAGERDMSTTITGKQPAMLDRLLGGFVHPFIHVGFAVEFGVTQQLAAALAHAAIHPSYPCIAFPLELLHSPPADPFFRGMSGPLKRTQRGPPPFLSFLADLLAEPRLTPEALGLPRDDEKPFEKAYIAVLESDALSVVKELLDRWYDAWTAGADEAALEDRLDGMVEDVIVTHAAIYAISGYAAKADTVFNADFFTMHFVTSANFIPCLVLRPERTRAQALNPPLPLASRLLLLRNYFAALTFWFLTRPLPTLASFEAAIPGFYAATANQLSPPVPAHAYPPGRPTSTKVPSHELRASMPIVARAWPRIIANTVAYPDEHHPKLMRALGAADTWYGRRAAGRYAGAIRGAELLDGTLFLRAAVLTSERMGWAFDEPPRHVWDRDGYRAAAAPSWRAQAKL